MFIIDFRNKLVSNNNFSVIGNNNVDVVYFFSHFTQYASGYNVYLKVISEDETYVDKILIDSGNISIDDGALLVKWTMGEVSTQCKKINVQLQFENNDGSIVNQTRIVSITLGDTIDVDGEIGHIYPKILAQLQEQIDTLKLESVKSMSLSFASDTLIISLLNKNGEVIATNQVSIPLSSKLDLVNELNKVYGTNAQGEQVRYLISESATPNSIAIRDTNGDVLVPLNPTALNGAVPKSYVDGRIDEIEQRSDVVDVVGTYAELQAYDTSTLSPNSLIKVINDETHDHEITYYRWVITGGVGAWVYVASEGAYYTTSQIDQMLANIDSKTFNVINASDIVNNTLTQEQYDLITNGKPTLIKGTFLGGYNNYFLNPPLERTNDFVFEAHYTTGYPAFVLGLVVVNKTTKVISLSTNKFYRGEQFNSIATDNFNGKLVPAYPITNALPQILSIAENGGVLNWTDIYNTIFNPNEASANDEIKWSKMLTFSKSADTTFTFETAKTNCLNEYKAIITNSGASAIVLTFTGITNILCNDDNCVISGNTLSLPSGTTIEINAVGGNLVAINFSAN